MPDSPHWHPPTPGWLAAYLGTRHIAAAQLARDIDYGQRHVSRWLAGETEIPRVVVYAMRYLYG
jgi:hypothetical protein